MGVRSHSRQAMYDNDPFCGAPSSVRGTRSRGVTVASRSTARGPSIQPNASAQPTTFVRILGMLLARSGANIMPLIDTSSVNQWASNPAGFQFRVKKPADIARIAAALDASPSFGKVTLAFDRVAKDGDKRVIADRAYREVGRPDSLHVVLFDDWRRPSIIHLDSHSIAVAKDSRTGAVIYSDDLRDLVTHVRRDLLHK
jgi:hypothetical protein